MINANAAVIYLQIQSSGKWWKMEGLFENANSWPITSLDEKMPLLRVLQQNKLIIAENGSSRHSPLQQLPGADESNPASHKQIWSMSIFPRHLVLSLVIWLKIIHQLAQICLLIGPQCTCYVFLVLSPRSFCREEAASYLENTLLKYIMKDIG